MKNILFIGAFWHLHGRATPFLQFFCLFCGISFFPQRFEAQTESAIGADSIIIEKTKRQAGIFVLTDQDVFQKAYNEDRNYTMGILIGVYGPFTDKNYLLFPFLRKKIDGLLGFDSVHRKNDALERYALSLFGSGFTPLDIANPLPVRDDRPYASLLAIASSHTSAKLSGRRPWSLTTELSIGVLGLNIAKNAQSHIHENHWLGSQRPLPMGWHNQISHGGEPTLLYRATCRNLIYEYGKINPKRHVKVQRLQISALYEGMIGYYTNAAAGVDVRLGFFTNPFWDANTGMSTGMSEAPTEGPKPKDGFEMFLYGSLRGRLVGYNALLQGQFRKSVHTMSATQIERLVGEYEFGLGIRLWKVQAFWGIIAGRSPEYRAQMQRPHVWGSVMLRYNFNYTEKRRIDLGR